MAPHAPGRRAGFTLVELLVAMSVIIVLATIALAVVPGALDQDRTTDAAATIRQHLMIAKARATREKDGRGVRFIASLDANNPAKTNAAWSTEMQYIEAAPTVVPNPLGLTGPTDPFIEMTTTPDGKWTLRNLPAASEAIQVIQNDLGANWFPKLYIPELGTDSFGRTQRFEIFKLEPAGGNDWTVTVWLPGLPPPNPLPLLTMMGSGTKQRFFRFAIEPRSRPLLGEPNITLPKNVCVDLAASLPATLPFVIPNGGGTVFRDFEVMFAPNGQVLDPVEAGQIFLWVRDYTKFSGNPAANNGANPPVYDMTGFQQGGEQQLVAIKAKSGALGVFPVAWPDVVAGSFGTYSGTGFPPIVDPYSFARNQANTP